MDKSKIIETEQELLRKENENKELLSKYESKKRLKIISLIAIPILLILALIFVNITEKREGSYYEETPYEPLAVFIGLILVPTAIVLAIIGYTKSKKLKIPVKETADNILKLKNDLIVLKNS